MRSARDTHTIVLSSVYEFSLLFPPFLSLSLLRLSFYVAARVAEDRRNDRTSRGLRGLSRKTVSAEAKKLTPEDNTRRTRRTIVYRSLLLLFGRDRRVSARTRHLRDLCCVENTERKRKVERKSVLYRGRAARYNIFMGRVLALRFVSSPCRQSVRFPSETRVGGCGFIRARLDRTPPPIQIHRNCANRRT